ncbi:MAG: hypothetical protein KJ856_14080 [Gammaproteobacteria bacterium]|uniref:Tail protein n=1 Tax=viral metagenome TaxID=1070528 RepID=A0A6H1ZPC5_9ZZZZ|nr:hypothetical protein [Shewanella sp. SP1S1-7]MBU1393705.1 hypothetical protein [Gammaproteobacteria bacterium]MBU1479238.1 hypothetical protein [Gammaproteobacteria bacterium]MBU2003038.1 hypothetical protein [Gammaproteobacteria bacterium]MBU2134138.1 hypothetical protein [Gammaproteobacteria bacterium]MBU2188118.1 hypothetical protein [Gammaproteobacteria bacterium]
MARIKIEGMEAVTKELNRIRTAQAPAINRAIEDSVKFGEKAAVDAIFNKYGFNSKSYVENLISYSVDPRNLKGFVTARYRSSSLTRFASGKKRIGKNGRSRADGHIIRSLRNEPHWFKGTFTFIGRNGNFVMYERHRGEKWRTFKQAKDKGIKAKYGPSVLQAFRGVEEDIEPPIIKHLRERYGHHASR